MYEHFHINMNFQSLYLFKNSFINLELKEKVVNYFPANNIWILILIMLLFLLLLGGYLGNVAVVFY